MKRAYAEGRKRIATEGLLIGAKMSKSAWNKGLNKDTDERVAQYARKVSKTITKLWQEKKT